VGEASGSGPSLLEGRLSAGTDRWGGAGDLRSVGDENAVEFRF
jgi:hypothetical protein